MYSRIIQFPEDTSFFLFGPRGTGKTTWLKERFPSAILLDLLKSSTFNPLHAQPDRLETMIPKEFQDWVILDEVQKIPPLLNEVHRLIENRKLKFILTGSSARKLKKDDVNLLAGRAITRFMHPLTVKELGNDFSLSHSLRHGHLPHTFQVKDPKQYLESYITTYLKEEVQQEGLTRNLDSFHRFLEAASFSQGGVLSFAEISRECSAHRKVVENYFAILEDLLIGIRLPVFTKKAKRKMIAHSKFYFFDVGVYQTLRPKGPLDSPEDIAGPSLETLVLQEIRALNDALQKGYTLFFWHTADHQEVDFILYGERGIKAIEVKRSRKVIPRHLRGLKTFSEDYPEAEAYFVYGGSEELFFGNIKAVPVEKFLQNLPQIL